MLRIAYQINNFSIKVKCFFFQTLVIFETWWIESEILILEDLSDYRSLNTLIVLIHYLL